MTELKNNGGQASLGLDKSPRCLYLLETRLYATPLEIAIRISGTMFAWRTVDGVPHALTDFTPIA